MNKKRLLAILIPIFILLAMTIIPISTLAFGTEILLETRPVDPRDLFRGDYVILSYKIEEIELSKFDKVLQEKLVTQMIGSFPQNKNLYVILKKHENGTHVVDYVSENKPSSNKLYIKGKFNNFLYQEPSAEARIMVSYNIDKYFVPENTGMELEEAARKGEVLAKVKLFKGYAMLTELIIP